MRLTNYTDYSLRVLMYLAIKKDGELSTILEIAESYNISKNHLMKIIHQLGQLGYIETIRGRNGGIKLAKHPKDINIGEVVSKTEEDFHIVNCFKEGGNYCAISPACKLKHALNEALQAFLNVLYGYTLEELVTNKNELNLLFRLSQN
ncbi:Rrf2 family transcriptional regulator [Caldibacillus lycopersici]|uniref:HTH-type transcriptional regulator NsrR n=1 Tax=Perspicuibacillus lycopersici TaxID=1325689 RepID=A0AAE3IUB7_9BACI|nr:Rrf2 family transcriptional regulator [Perspicuibacillus lycopersici]MCU9614572.1 Rrf2 family transcriptional regulator [Perspicuibacillus lycopersici]